MSLDDLILERDRCVFDITQSHRNQIQAARDRSKYHVFLSVQSEKEALERLDEIDTDIARELEKTR